MVRLSSAEKLALAAGAEIASTQAAELKQFSNGAGSHPGFTFTRYWWEGDGPREGIRPWVEKKVRPGDDPTFGHAVKAEPLVPADAPGDYAHLGFLIERFDAMLQPFERHAFVQVKVELDSQEPWHKGYEVVREYARAHFVGRGHAVILVAHVPGLAGSANAPHVHAIVLSRVVCGANGFGATSYHLCSDKGHAEAWEAWQRHLTGTGR